MGEREGYPDISRKERVYLVGGGRWVEGVASSEALRVHNYYYRYRLARHRGGGRLSFNLLWINLSITNLNMLPQHWLPFPPNSAITNNNIACK